MSRCFVLPFLVLLTLTAGCGGGTSNTSDAPKAADVYAISAKSEVLDLRGSAEVGPEKDQTTESNLATLVEDLTTFEAGSSGSNKPAYTELLKVAQELKTLFEGKKWTPECETKYGELKALADKLPSK